MSVLDGLLDLAILTDKVEGVAEPAGGGDDGYRQIGHRCRDGRIAPGEPSRPIKGRGRTCVDGGDAGQLVRIGLLEVDRINGHHQHLWLLLGYIVLGERVEALE